MKILTKEDIEKSGCVYEPDESKCSVRKIRVHLDCCYYKDGQWKNPIATEIPDGPWKEGLIEMLREYSLPWSYINDVFVPDIQPLSGEGVMCRWVMIKGHKDNTNDITAKWEKTGLLDPLTDSDKNKCAALLETAAILLLGELKKYSEEIDKLYDSVDFFTFAGLRAVRWLYGDYVLAKSQSLDIKELIDDFYKFCLKYHMLYVDFKTSPLDVETEFVSMYAYYFIESHK